MSFGLAVVIFIGYILPAVLFVIALKHLAQAAGVRFD